MTSTRDLTNDLFNEPYGMTWWASIVLGGLVYVVLKFILPEIFVGSLTSMKLARVLHDFAAICSALFVVPGLIAGTLRARGRKSTD